MSDHISITIPNDSVIIEQIGAALIRISEMKGETGSAVDVVTGQTVQVTNAHPREIISDESALAKVVEHAESFGTVEITPGAPNVAVPPLADTPEKTAQMAAAAFAQPTPSVPVITDPAPTPVVQSAAAVELDADGIPWDARIHSSSKEKTQKGTFRQIRTPTGRNKAEFAQEVANIKAQLKAQHAGSAVPAPAAEATAPLAAPTPSVRAPAVAPAPVPAETPVAAPVQIPAVVAVPTQAEAAPVQIPAVVAVPTQAEAAPVAAPAPAAAPAPVAAPVAGAITDFQGLMALVTGNTAKINVNEVGDICAQHGVENLMKMNNHPELIPAVAAAIQAAIAAK